MNTFAVIQNFSMSEVLIVGLIVVLFFGARRLPELFGSLGKSINEFKRGIREDNETPIIAEREQPQPETSKTV